MNDVDRERLIALVRDIVDCAGTEEEVDAWIDEFVNSVPHPQAGDLIFYNELSAEEVVDRALAYEPTRLPPP